MVTPTLFRFTKVRKYVKYAKGKKVAIIGYKLRSLISILPEQVMNFDIKRGFEKFHSTFLSNKSEQHFFNVSNGVYMYICIYIYIYPALPASSQTRFSTPVLIIKHSILTIRLK